MVGDNYPVLRGILEKENLTEAERNTLDWAIRRLEILERQESEMMSNRECLHALSKHADNLGRKVRCCTKAIQALTEAITEETTDTIYCG